MLKLPRHLRLDILLEATENERTNDTVQSGDDFLVLVCIAALNHARHRIGEPVRELFPGPEDVRHEEVQETPQLHEIVLQRCSCKEESTLRVEVDQRLPSLALKVLDILCLVH